MSAVTAVVPLRGSHGSKTRLAGMLTATARSALVAALARHVVGTLVETDAVSRILVVTEDPVFARSVVPGAARRVHVLQQPPACTGLNAAVGFATQTALAEGAHRLLVVHADLAALTTDDVVALLAQSSAITLAPDRPRGGTNALVLSAAVSAFTFRFGTDSFRAHHDEATKLGVEPAVVLRAGTVHDLDTVDDWTALPPRVRRRLADAVPGAVALAGLPD